MTSIEQRLQVVEDTLAITALMTAYQEACDGWDERGTHREPQTIAALFTADGTWAVTAREPAPTGHDEIAALAVDLQSIAWIVHVAANPKIEVNGDTATAQFKGILRVRLTAASRAAWSLGLYRIEALRTSAGWRFRSMTWEPMTEQERFTP